MNPFIFIYNDFKQDFIVIKRIFTEKGFLEARIKYIEESLKSLKFNELLAFAWPLLILFAAFFFAGWFIAAKYYQGIANQAIYDAVIPTIKNAINFSVLK
jgi:hypothetical protein